MAGLDVLNPITYAPNLLVPFRKSLVFGSVANRDYEGEIRNMGDSVKIREIGTVTINDYSKFTNTGSTSTAITWQALSAAEKSLLIDEAKYFAFAIDDVDMTQNFPKAMAQGMDEAGYAIADEIDQDIAEKMADGSGNIVTAATISAGSCLGLITQFARELNEANVPQEGRFMFIPPFYHQDLLDALSGAIGATGVPKVFDNGVIYNGFVGNLYGINLLLTNNCHTSAGTAIITACHRSAVTFAGQLSQIKRTERENYFDQGVKGLYLYGIKVVRPSAIVSCDVTEG